MRNGLGKVHIERVNPNNTMGGTEWRLPTGLERAKRIGDSYLMLEMTRAWTFKLRVHNAAKMVEPSLKLSIQLAGVPEYAKAHVVRVR